MKKIYIILTILVFSISSCTDLTEQILDEKNNYQLITDTANVETLVAPAYVFLRDMQSRNAGWLVGETTTDECVFPTRGSNWNNADYRTLFTHTYTASNSYIKNTWNSYLIGFSRCNMALYYMHQMPQSAKVIQYENEVLFVRTLAMYQLNDFFGKMPYREYSQTAFELDPQYLDRAQVVEKMIATLNEIIPNMKDKKELAYGRITKSAAKMLLAKIYLNYQVYTGTAPTFADGTAKWDETIALCDDIINSGNFGLADDYWKMFLADNAAYAHATEAILPIIYNPAAGYGGIPWLNMTLNYNQFFGSYTSSSMWNGCCTTPEFFATWDTTDKRFQDNRLKATTGLNLGFLYGQQFKANGDSIYTKDTSKGYNNHGRPLNFTTNFVLANSDEEMGVRVIKYAPNAATAYPGSSENDYLYYRYADVYLMRAEAKFRKGDTSGALSDINTLRAKRGSATLSSLTLDAIYNERGYELYWENHRRNDMVRFNKYLAPRTEKATTDAAYTILLPVPLSAYEADKNTTQNPGYAAFK